MRIPERKGDHAKYELVFPVSLVPLGFNIYTVTRTHGNEPLKPCHDVMVLSCTSVCHESLDSSGYCLTNKSAKADPQFAVNVVNHNVMGNLIIFV